MHASERRCCHCGTAYDFCAAPIGRACCGNCNHYAAHVSPLMIAAGPDAVRPVWPLVLFTLAFAAAAVLSMIGHD